MADRYTDSGAIRVTEDSDTTPTTWPEEVLEAFLEYLGATEDQDGQADLALNLALDVVEHWLDRPLELKERTQEDTDVAGVILLQAWPVVSVASVTIDNGQPGGQVIDLAYTRLAKQTGRLAVGGRYGWGVVVTVYSGGFPFDAFPADLQFALFAIGAALFPQLAPGAGAGGGTGQPVVRVSTPDVGLIEFARAGAGGVDSRILGATLSPAIDSMLSRYRNQSVIGGA